MAPVEILFLFVRLLNHGAGGSTLVGKTVNLIFTTKYLIRYTSVHLKKLDNNQDATSISLLVLEGLFRSWAFASGFHHVRNTETREVLFVSMGGDEADHVRLSLRNSSIE